MKLSELNINEKAVILRVSDELTSNERRRLLDLGFVVNEPIEIKFFDVSKSLFAVSVKNTTFAIRKKQADSIYIERKT